MNLKTIAAIALTAMLTVPAMAADDAKPKKKGAKGDRAGGQNVAAQLIKQLEPVGLTEEQTSKIKEMGKAEMASMKKLREESGITPELMKKRTEAQKSLKDSGKKGKDMIAAINEKAGLSEAQVAAFKTLSEARGKFQKSVLALLTDEQKGKLPERMQKMLKAGGAKKAGAKKGDGAKKKKKDAA